MSLALYLLDPDPAPVWAPFAGVRPISELRAGAYLIRERWETFVGAEATEVFAQAHLAGFTEPGVPPVVPRRAARPGGDRLVHVAPGIAPERRRAGAARVPWHHRRLGGAGGDGVGGAPPAGTGDRWRCCALACST
jgi:hypothetical protein